MQSFKVLAALLTYPGPELLAAVRSGELQAVLDDEGLLTAGQRAALAPLFAELASGDPLDLEERYVGLFDRSNSRSLHLFEHVHGEGRDRGQALVDLTAMYADAGLEVAEKELPDYLPLFLDYLSRLPPADAFRRLAQPIHIVAVLARRLADRGSPYAAVFQVLEALSAEPPDLVALGELLKQPDDDPDDAERLDADWEEEAVSFGPPGPGGPDGEAPCQRMARIAASLTPAEPTAA